VGEEEAAVTVLLLKQKWQMEMCALMSWLSRLQEMQSPAEDIHLFEVQIIKPQVLFLHSQMLTFFAAVCNFNVVYSSVLGCIIISKRKILKIYFNNRLDL
jgi:hypothetical protein